MAITANTIKEWISALGFIPAEGEVELYHKIYAQHNGYVLCVDFSREIIYYADRSFKESAQITVGSRATSNFANPENLVVLDCVDRLLEKGYTPGSIELEKVYPSGRGHSGELDILVNDAKGQAFLMIECKTWEKEYNKEIEKMLTRGGQLFTYFKNATSSKFLCLYSSRLVKDKIEYENSIVDVSEEWRTLSETKDIHERWNKIFKKNGIFEAYASPYNIVHKRLTYGDLATMKDEDSKKIFHQIMTILRHNGVSDKPNAFNKLLNLFVCKMIDEDRNTDEELQFQCWEGLADEKLQMTLNDLYKEGMLRFLEIRVIDHSENDINNILQELGIGNSVQKQKLLNMFSDTRLKKSPNFAFVEVQDEKTFQLNAKIVREVVELLQHYQFRYDQKHEFLGDFFEKMLNTSMKQEAGQFFTPVPITRFIISSMPLRDFVQKKINAKDPNPLPSVIDYACGSGHFLTEFMSEMQKIIETVDVENAQPRTRNKLNSWRGDVKFSWADEYVYGIDFDNRLVKTAKVSAFFNGDGEATIIWGDGLDSFEHSDVYRGKLKAVLHNKQDNGQFDILISNPPYSVDAFRRMLKYGAESFELFDGLTDNSSEIECLFVERMKQLLKIGGWAGVILPSSILSNSGIYSRTRDIIFKYFNVKAIVEFGSGTFMETGTNTVALFLERRSDSDHEKITQAIDTFFTNKRDVTVLGIERAFSAFVANAYDGLDFKDYLSFVNENLSDVMNAHELYRDYVKEFGDTPFSKAFTAEREKMLYFMLTYNQTIVVAKSGKSKEEIRAFLGYKFSDRRGYEGIKPLSGSTMLFDEESMSNPQKVNSYILNAFLGEVNSRVDETVANHVSYGRMSDFFEYGTGKFNKRVNLRKPIRIKSRYSHYSLGELCEIRIGGTPSRNNPDYFKGTELWASVSELNSNEIFDTKEKITFDAVKNSNVKLVKKGTTLMSFKLSIGKTAIAGKDLYTNEAIAALVPINKEFLLDKYLFCLLSVGFIDLQSIKGDNAFGKSLNSEHLKELKIPLPPLNVQHEIVAAFESISKEIKEVKKNIEKAQVDVNAKFFELFGDPITNPMGWDVFKLGSLSSLITKGASPNWQGFKYTDDSSQTLFVTSENVREGYLKFDTHKYVEDEFNQKQNRSMLQNGDFLINIVGASIGRAAQYTLDKKANVNQAVAVVRLNKGALNDEYLNFYLNSPKALEMYSSMQIELARANLSLQNISDLDIMLPPLKLQNDFAEFIHKTTDTISKLQQTLCELSRNQNGILTKYL